MRSRELPRVDALAKGLEPQFSTASSTYPLPDTSRKAVAVGVNSRLDTAVTPYAVAAAVVGGAMEERPLTFPLYRIICILLSA
eukprot:CAMPEP_0173279188 /NCGR_PEP_ID=MMETSP1143-20121109/5013_1 /TAXON_ID=483371 /ORGANISM="non described non described, Strain CCMP2298" /LENGTH=82 /DNA_ID=CAMNT_0014216395 /DNA_START=218 /DNA_END=462 /DNA_ORIENTATION=-